MPTAGDGGGGGGGELAERSGGSGGGELVERSGGSGGGGELVERAGGSGGGELVERVGGSDEDRLSLLPDELLHSILLRLPSTAAAAQTSLLSRRWRFVWAAVPEIHFPLPTDPAIVAAAIAGNAAPALCRVVANVLDASAGSSTAAWLRPAARRLSGSLFLKAETLVFAGGDGDDDDEAALELPCLENATKIQLFLGHRGLALPVSGVFARLTSLQLFRLWFHSQCELGDAVSSPRCPSLQRLRVDDTRGTVNLAIRSESLVEMALVNLRGLRSLKVVAPMLTTFRVWFCFAQNQPVADLYTPVLETLEWKEQYDLSYVQLCELPLLRDVDTCVRAYRSPGHLLNRSCTRLFRRSPIIFLRLMVAYPVEDSIGFYQHMMDELTLLPDVITLSLTILPNRHNFGASVFHLLRSCTGIRTLTLQSIRTMPAGCALDCSCHQPPNWRTEHVSLEFLQEVEICDIEGAEHEVVLLKQLFKWAGVLKNMRITFRRTVTVSDDLCRNLLSLSHPKTSVELFIYRNGCKVLYVPVD